MTSEETPAAGLNAEFVRLRQRARFWTGVWLVSGAVAFTGNVLPDRWVNIPLVGLLVFLATWWPAHRFRERYGREARRREAQPIAAQGIGSIERQPVLYLRSFDDDQRAARSVRGFIVFDDRWQASCLRARGPGLYFFCTNAGQVGHTAKRLARTLRPVFRTLDTSWQRPPLNWPLIVLSAISAGLFLLAIVAEILGL